MRIISGKFRGKRLTPPSNLKSRPTTDFAKEGLFNVLSHLVEFEDLFFLDLFAGTGNITYELMSRGAQGGVMVDIALASIKYRAKMIEQMNLENVQSYKSDALRYLRSCKLQFDLIFCDPPYEKVDLPKIMNMIWERNLLKPNGYLIVEHPKEQNFSQSTNFVQQRDYGKVNFSFFQSSETEVN